MGKIGFIYLTTNKVNNKKYIGQRHYHSNSKADDRYLGSGLLILKAIRKYGAENFSREILEECETQEELDLAEKKWIKEYNAVADRNFYNIAEGGLSTDDHPLRPKRPVKFKFGKMALRRF
jgi:group I intron endonuclease